MNDTFAPFLGKFVVIYMDDILVYSKSQDEHVKHLHQVLSLLREAKPYAKLSKCDFLKHELDLLGYVISAEGVKVDPKKLQSVQEWPCPTDVKSLRSFLGLATFFRRFVQGYSSLTAPLTILLRKDCPWRWSPECEHAFCVLKEKLTVAPVLAVPEFDQPFEVWCHASGIGLGAVLLQNGCPCAFESRKLRGPKLNSHPGETELLAVIHALKTWRGYLQGKQDVQVCTDHNPLVWLQTQPNLLPKQVRWVGYLQRFPFKWKYIPGKTNVADPLCRMPDSRDALNAPSIAVAQSSCTSPPERESQAVSPLSDFEKRCVANCLIDP